MKTALLVMVHGSPRPVANEDMCRVVELVSRRGVFDLVAVGFLECNAPSIPEAIDDCAARGAEQIMAVPYFLHTGAHVAEDLPALLAAGQARHPQITFLMGRNLGESEKVTEILRERIAAAVG